jgi:phosphoribosylglycinamide formyltransferase 1
LSGRAIGVLVSGRGSNLQALMAAAADGRLGGTVAVVISNVADAAALPRAHTAGIPAHFIDHAGRPRDVHDREMAEVLRAHDVSLVCLAGYMRLLSADFIRAFSGRILNVHPSLLPAFPGRDAARQAFEHGVQVTGATVHFVDEGLDSGPIVLQEAVAVKGDDTPETLAARILEVEHRIYPRAVRMVLDGDLRMDGRRIRRRGPAA